MLRTLFSWGLAALLVPAVLATALLSTPAAYAVPPDTLRHYHILPRHSGLLQTGGIAGVTNRFRVEGEYDFLQLWRGGTPTDPLVHFAKFDNADVRAPVGEFLPAFIDVDELLNIEGLRGELLPLGAPFDVYRFRGFINDSDAASPSEQSSIDLFAALLGPWMYLYGETTPPPGSADYFEYKIKALARTRPWTDMNDDGRVDGADYTLLRDDGYGEDYLADWRGQFGETLPDLAGLEATMSAAMAASRAVPEPTAIVLITIASVGVVSRRRR